MKSLMMSNATLSVSLAKGLGHFFYLINPIETSYEEVEAVPEFYHQSWPYFLVFILLENVVLFLEGKPTIRINDGVTSLSHGIIHQCSKILFRGAENALYISIYEHWRLYDASWDSAITWYAAALGVDFCYYWVHRASHEMHILWAQHQVHHSSEEYNLAVGLRQSALHSWCGFIFYLPLALVVPPSHFITHQQFSLMFQFWLHTKAVESMGPLEWVFNTPRHHRVHHGCNLYCLDKNYGGVLIIWDRMFGTFANPRPNEDIVYGLVFNQPSFNPLHLQTFYTIHMVNKFRTMVGWRNKLSAIIKGPSWEPGSPWTGRDEDKIDVRHRDKYDISLPLWCNVYVLVHFAVVVLAFQELCLRHMGMSQLSVFGFVAYILCSLTTIGLVLENQTHARVLEITRCIALATLVRRGTFAPLPSMFAPALQLFFAVSAVLCTLYTLQLSGHKEKTA